MSLEKYRVPPKRSPYYVNKVESASFVVGAEVSNTITINVTLKDVADKNVSQVVGLQWYLSANSDGTTFATAASGGVAAGAKGHVLAAVAGRSGTLTTNNNGEVDVVITDTSVRDVYLTIILPDGTLAVSPVAAFT